MTADRVPAAAMAVIPNDPAPATAAGSAATWPGRLDPLSDTDVTPDPFTSMRSLRLGPLVLSEGHLREANHQSGAPAGATRGHVRLHLVVAGTLRAELPGRQVEIGIGEIALFDADRPLRLSADHADLVIFQLTPAVIDAAARAAGDLHGIVIDATRAGLLADFMRALLRHAHAVPVAAIAGAVRAFVEVLATALPAAAPVGDGDAPGREKLERARALVEARLTRKDLRPSLIAVEAGLCRSSLYELFKPLGGVSRYVQARRADRLRMLLSQPGESRSIAELAFQAGFASDSHASRTFRQLFGMSPGQFRRSLLTVARQAEPHAAAAAMTPGHPT